MNAVGAVADRRPAARGKGTQKLPFAGNQVLWPNIVTVLLPEENPMDWNRVEGNWKQIKGKIKEKWGQLTDDDLDAINGGRGQLEGKIQERYGLAKNQVRRDIDDWYASQRW